MTSRKDKQWATGGDLETQKAERSVWIIKCPSLLRRHWESENCSDAPSSQRRIGKLVLSIDPLQSGDQTPSPTQFTMELDGNKSENVPMRYSVDMLEDIYPMCAFSQTNQGKVCVEGKALTRFDMKLTDEHLEDYSKLCRERTKKYAEKSRQVKVLDDRDGHLTPMPGMVGLTGKDKKKSMPVKESDAKRTRTDRGEMENILFKLFERQPNWTLRQLIAETDQPEQFLKDMLKDLCIYNNKGSNQGTYELKPEYKRSDVEVIPK